MQTWKVLVSCLALGTAGVAMAQDKPQEKPKDQPPARAQPPAGERPARDRQPGQGGGQQRQALAPEKAKAAQELEAKGVAKRLNLNDDQTKALVKAYTDARASFTEANTKFMEEQRKAMEDGADRSEMAQKRQDMMKKEREKFTKAVTTAISGDVATKVGNSLGSFNGQWDRFVDTIAGFNLEAAKQQDALNAVEDFVVAQTKARESAGDGTDRESQMAAMRETRTKLTDALKKVLSEEQMGKIQPMLGGGGRQGGGPGGGGGEGGDQPRRRRPGGGDGGGGGGGGR